MRFLRQFERTVRLCGRVLKYAAFDIPLHSLLPPILSLAAFQILLRQSVEVPLAFVLAYALGFSLLIWLQLDLTVKKAEERKWSVWLVLVLFPMTWMTLVVLLESPAAALRLAYLYIGLRALVLLMDLVGDDTFVVRRLWKEPWILANETALTKVLFLRDIAMILFVETVIAVGSVPLMLAVLVLWPITHFVVDRIVLVSVHLVFEDAKRR
jgi:hypothetical protein